MNICIGISNLLNKIFESNLISNKKDYYIIYDKICYDIKFIIIYEKIRLNQILFIIEDLIKSSFCIDLYFLVFTNCIFY